MSTQGIRDFRPNLHFTAPQGWINDPNGLVFHKGTYHLFYQHYPYDGIWGPMHWGHATSTDLLSWTHHPIALYPQGDKMIFSGSAVIDVENRSGLGQHDKPPLIALYTAHSQIEEQAIAYSLDHIHFVNYSENPVILNPGISDFRDPKLFFSLETNHWHMALAAKDRVHFYVTEDFKHYRKTGEFGPEGNYAPGVWECPDMVPLDYEGKRLWMLIVSMGSDEENGFASTQYFLGTFDGETFTNAYPHFGVNKLDFGCDNYAGVTFNQCNRHIIMGWALNWGYAKDTPTGLYCGHMTIPRELSLLKTPLGPVAAMKPIALEGKLRNKRLLQNGGKIQTETFLLQICGEGAFDAELHNADGQSLHFGIDERNQVYLDRSNAGDKDFSSVFAKPTFAKRIVERLINGRFTLDFLFDVSIAELFMDGGSRCISMVVYPDSPYTSFTFSGNVSATIFTG